MSETAPTRTVTEYEQHAPWLAARFVNGRVELLHLERFPADPHGAEEALAGVREALSVALATHRAALVDAVVQASDPPAAGDHASAVSFALDQLAEAQDLEPSPQAAWFPDQADGRDESGQVHVSVTPHGVAILEAPQHLLADRLRLSDAIRQALNLALTRLDEDTGRYARRWADQTQDPPDWSELATRADELRSM